MVSNYLPPQENFPAGKTYVSSRDRVGSTPEVPAPPVAIRREAGAAAIVGSNNGDLPWADFLKSIADKVAAEQREAEELETQHEQHLEAVFAPVTGAQENIYGADKYSRFNITDSSITEADREYGNRIEGEVKDIIDRHLADNPGIPVHQLVRENAGLRMELGKYFLGKLTKMQEPVDRYAPTKKVTFLPSRVNANIDSKRPNIKGYNEPMSNFEYVAALGLSMLDATFKYEYAPDTFHRDNSGAVTEDQHRYAAGLVLRARGWS